MTEILWIAAFLGLLALCWYADRRVKGRPGDTRLAKMLLKKGMLRLYGRGRKGG